MSEIVTDATTEPMAEVLLYRMTQIGFPLTYRQKALGQALFRFIASRNDVFQLPSATPKRGKWTGLRL